LEEAEIFAQHSKSDDDLNDFLREFFHPFFEELEKMICYTHYMGKQKTLAELKRIIQHPLVQKAVRLVPETQANKISLFCIRHKLTYLLYFHLWHQNRGQAWFADHNLAVRSIYRDRTQALREAWAYRVNQKLHAFAAKKKHILIYGAGVYGRGILQTFKRCGLNADGFVVSGSVSNESRVDGLPVYSITALPFPRKGTAIIVALSDKYRKEVVPLLQKQGWKFYG
jgi:hypothetical protein